MYKLDIMGFPHVKVTQAGAPKAKQPLTTDNIMHILTSVGIKLRMNVMLNRFEFVGPGITPDGVSQTHVLMEIEDTLTMLDIAGLNRVPEMLERMARKNDPYHPVEDWILSKKWDGTDRLGLLAATVPTDSVVWPEYLRKWLIQSIEAVRGWRSGTFSSIPHVLIFVGGQGAGKGRWLRHLAPGFVLADAELHLGSFAAKDQQLQVLDYTYVELGEIDSTLKKSEMSALKAFLSRQFDEIRKPYARGAVKRPRMSVFAGSVNNLEFINDPTGARRFWPVHVTGELDWDHGIDMQQVLAQVNHYWDVEQEDWNLEEATIEKRAEEMERFMQQSAAVDLVSGQYYRWRQDYKHYAILNKSEISQLVRSSLHPANLSNVTEWLHQKVAKPRKLRGKQRSWAFPVGMDLAAMFVAAGGELLTETEAKKYALEHKPV